MKYSQFVETFQLQGSGKLNFIQFTNKTRATEFYKVLQQCSSCDISKIELIKDLIQFDAGHCENTANIREMMLTKLNTEIKFTRDDAD